MKRLRTFDISADLSLPLKAVTQRFVIIGQSESGKSNLAILLAELMLRAGALIAVLDAGGIWWALKTGFSIYVFGGEHVDFPLTPSSGALMADLIIDKQISAVLDVSEFTPAELRQFVADFAQQLFLKQKRSKKPRHLFIEEAHGIVPQELFEKQNSVMLGRMLRVLKVLRNYGLGWSMVSQEPQSLNKRGTDQASTFFAGRTIGATSKKAVMEIVSDLVSENDLALLTQLPKLETGQFVVFSPSWLKLTKVIRIRYRTTFDAGKPREFRGARSGEPKKLKPVDVEKLRAVMTQVTEQAEREDPAALLRQVSELKAKLAKAERAPGLAGKPKPAPALLAEVEEIVVERPVVRQVRRFEAQAGKLSKIAAAMRAESLAIDKTCLGLVEAIGRVAEATSAAVRRADEKAQAEKVRSFARRYAAPPEKIHAAVRGEAKVSPAPEGEVKLKDGARRILAVLKVVGRPLWRPDIGVLATISPTSGTMSDYLSVLKTGGLVREDDRGVDLTPAGLARAGTISVRLGDVVARWHGKGLKAGARRMVEVLTGSGSDGVDRSALGEATGISPTSGTMSDYLSTLRRAGLVEDSGKKVRLRGILFEMENSA